MRPLYRFHGGVHPSQHKEKSSAQPITMGPLPPRLLLPLRQHIGNPAKPLVKPGDEVLKGQMVARAEGYVSAAIHAPTSGTVTAVAMHAVPHPSGLPDRCITLEPDGEERWIEHGPIDYQSLDPSTLRNRLRDAGVVGLGGAVFPSFIKLNPGVQQTVPILILNGAECEPWITCDDRLMQERADQIAAGIAVMRFMLGSEKVLVGIEDNKPAAIASMGAACAKCDFPVAVVPVPTLYPAGGAKQLTRVLTGREIPSNGRSSDVGVACFNVATAYTVHRAIGHGEPVLSRIVTVTGNVRRPRNFEALIGTPINDLVLAAGGAKADTERFIMGGPMMGFDLPSLEAPLVKASNCVIAASPALFAPAPPPTPCIRCGRCARACPAELQPHELYWFARGKNFGKAQEYALFDCIECGCCSYVCPSHIPLVQYYRFAKSDIWTRESEKKAADLARERHEFRQFRLQREKRERAEKLAQKAAPKTAPSTTSDAEAKKAAILAAVERAKAKKAAILPRNVNNLPPEALEEIEKIETRRAEIKKMAHRPVTGEKNQ